jgi:hypothetical protein
MREKKKKQMRDKLAINKSVDEAVEAAFHMRD